MRLDVTFPDGLEPGQLWALDERDLPPGVAGLRIGAVYTAERADGSEVPVLVDAARREDAGRVYDLVVLGERLDAARAFRVIDALLDLVQATDASFILTENGVDVAVLRPPARSDTRKALADLAARLAPGGEYVTRVREREQARRDREAAIMALLTAGVGRAPQRAASRCVGAAL